MMEKKNPLSNTNGAMDRRSFLKLSGLLGVGLASASLIPATAEAVRFNRKLHKVSRTKLAMGTFVSMTLFHPSRDKAQEAIGQAFQEIDRLTGLMNRFDNATAVSELNSEGFLRDVPPEVAHVVMHALHYYRLSDGTFDISVKPIIDLFRKTFAQGGNRPPSENELKEVLGLVGADKIELKGHTIRFRRPGMGITLDGIAKGYIVDSASKILASNQIRDHLINAGGDIRTMGAPGQKKQWTVAIQDPQKKKHYPDIIHMSDGAIATSGNYEVYYDREKMFHHIVDPRTGLSPELSTSVSVMARTAMDADAMSTTAFVMNPTKATRLIDSIPGYESLVVAKGGRKFKSMGWKSAAI